MATTRQLNNSHFKRGSGVYTCRVCSHVTRNTGGDGANVQACDICFDLAGEENHISDNGGGTYGSTENVKRLLAALDKRNGSGTAWAHFPTVCKVVGYES